MSKQEEKTLGLEPRALVGIRTVQLLLQLKKYENVYAVSLHIIRNLQSISEQEDKQVNHYFSCLDLKRRHTSDKNIICKIEYDYPTVAKSIVKNIRQTASYVFGIGINNKSTTFCIRLRRKTEDTLTQIGFKCIRIMSLAHIIEQRHNSHFSERAARMLFCTINSLLGGSTKKYRTSNGRAIPADTFNLDIIEKNYTYHSYN